MSLYKNDIIGLINSFPGMGWIWTLVESHLLLGGPMGTEGHKELYENFSNFMAPLYDMI